MGLNLYLAASWSRKDEIDALIPLFEDAGHTVVSTWTKEKGESNQWLDEFSDTYLRLNAERDLLEVQDADVLVLFSQGQGKATRGGGRFFEAGYAAACGIPTLVVGDREIIFHYLPTAYQVPEISFVSSEGTQLTNPARISELLWTLDQLEMSLVFTQEVSA